MSKHSPQNDYRRVHFVGVAGSGMAGLAYVAHKSGLEVSGSDLRESTYVQALLREGIELVFEHKEANVADSSIEVVVASTAIPSTNPEIIAAHERGIPVWHRAQMLAWLGRNHQTLAVAGTHGKTTTSAMLATALVELGANPAFLIGGVLNAYESSAHYTEGGFMVAEADESDSSFVHLDPHVAIITNLEADHMDHFKSLDEIKQCFLLFLEKLDSRGIAVVCADSPGLVELVQKSGKPFISYGTAEAADVRLHPLTGQVHFAQGKSSLISLSKSPGLHNLLNATAVMATLDWLGFDCAQAAAAVSTYEGAHRRYDLIGEANGVKVIDDYAHHPTEVEATLAAAKGQGYSAVHLLFQPHRFSRTQAFLTEFATSFDDATTITLMPVFTAGEIPIPGIDSNRLLKAIKQHNPRAHLRLIDERMSLAKTMADVAERGSVIITMGAGDVTYLAPEILEELKRREETHAHS
ncbi:MAG: UDP-N-acetylmuramate--L-alanine ligase [Coriobacteriia bacterium]|nr:UDP-N-acetylmuramate--L-alanine ligase [Coriobacteriia bacterium]